MKKLIYGTCAMVLLVFTNGIYAQQGYVGVGLGVSNVDDPSGLVDDSDTGVKIFGGYNVNEQFAIEAFYVDLGEPSTTSFGSTSSTQISGFGVEAVGFIPMDNQFSLFGKIGLFSWDEDYLEDGVLTFSDSGTDLTYGFGVDYALGNMGIRGEYEFYDVEDAAGNIDASLLSVGIYMSF